MTSLSVIIPTLGRPTLERAIASARNQLREGDEIIIVADPAGDLDHAYNLAQRWALSYDESASDGLGVGGSQRRLGMEIAEGSHLCFMDDDDAYLPGGLAALREAAADRPVCARVKFGADVLIWREPELKRDNISGIGICVPNLPGQFGEWRGHDPDRPDRGADYTFFAGCCDLMGPPIFITDVVAEVQPK